MRMNVDTDKPLSLAARSSMAFSSGATSTLMVSQVRGLREAVTEVRSKKQ